MPEILAANQEHFLLEIDGSKTRLRVLQFNGREAISQCFIFSVKIEADKQDLEPSQMCGSPVKFQINSRGYWRTICGIVGRFEICGVDRGYGIYNLDIVPALYLLEFTRQNRIFQHLSVVDVLRKVIATANIETLNVKFDCRSKYSALEYCVQYRESDLGFFQRLIEQHGLHYFFAFEKDKTRVIIGDSSDIHPEINGELNIPYRQKGGLVPHEDAIYQFRRAHRIKTGKRIERDYNFQTPSVDLSRDDSSSYAKNLCSWGYPGRFQTQEEAAQRARILRETDDCARSFETGQSDSVRLIPGHVFRLNYFPVNSLNDKYLVTSVIHDGGQPSVDNTQFGDVGYDNDFSLQKASVPFRSHSTIAKPVIEGTQTAVVTGPPGEEISTDKYGRITVRFHWDVSKSKDDQSSCWIRVAQTWAGKGWGAVVIPRIGQEVLVTFLEGDPDRPVVTGCLYNAANMPPYDLPARKMVSAFRSDSSLGSGGQNEIRLDDTKGDEEFYLHSQKNTKIITENDKDQSTGNNENLSVGKNRTKSVKADEQVSVGGNRTESVDKDESVSIGKNRSLTVGDNQTVSIGKDSSVDVGKDLNVTIADDSNESVGKSFKIQVGKDHLVTINKAYSCSAKDSMLLASDKDITLKCGSASIVLKKNGDIQIKGKNISVKGSGNVSIKGSKITGN